MTSSVARSRMGRTYTRARRHPWVLGKIGDWTLPLGPYTPAQLTVAFFGAFALIKTFSWWSALGPLPVVVWGVAVWAVRNPKIGGRSPMYVAAGLVELALRPRCGRIGGRAAKERRPQAMYGGFVVEEDQNAVPVSSGLEGVGAPAVRPRRRILRRAAGPRRANRSPQNGGPAPTALQRMLRSTSPGGR